MESINNINFLSYYFYKVPDFIFHMYHCMKRILYVHANINGKYVIGARNTVWFKEKEECYFHHKKIIVKNVILAQLFRPESVRVDIAGFGVAA